MKLNGYVNRTIYRKVFTIIHSLRSIHRIDVSGYAGDFIRRRKKFTN
jgi:hypothetical protein